MRPTFRSAAVALVLAAALAATGCTHAAEPTETPAPTSTPLFASDEEALAAAEQAYAAYTDVSDSVYEDGGLESERLSAVATGSQLEADISGMKEVSKLGYHSVGKTTFDTVRLQQYDPDATSGISIVVVYLCQDVGDVDVLDASGLSVVLPTRPIRTEFEVTFDRGQTESDVPLLVSNRTPWSQQTC